MKTLRRLLSSMALVSMLLGSTEAFAQGVPPPQGASGNPFQYLDLTGKATIAAPTTASTGRAKIFFDTTKGKLQQSISNGAWADLSGGSSGPWTRTGTVLSPTTAGDAVRGSAGTGALPSYSFLGDTGAGMSLGDGFLQFSMTGVIQGQFDQSGYFYPGSQTDVAIASISTHVITFSSGAGDHAGVGVVGGVSLNVVTSTSGPVALPLSSAHNNAGAVVSVTFNLPLTPSVSSGTQSFRVVAAQNVVIRAPNGVTVYMGAMAAPVGGTWTSSTPGSTVTLEYQGSSIWVATADTGIWVPS